MNLSNILFIDSLPTLDLHSLDRDTARVYIEDFIRDHVKMKDAFIIIVHGIHGGILKKETHCVLKHHKQVVAFQIWPYNPGCTVVQLKVDKS